MSREPPPPLPDGFVLGEQVYYTGAGKTLEGGNRLEHGKQGEVVGAVTSANQKGKGVDVLFPGNKRAITCLLTSVRRCRAATHSSLPPQLPILPAHHTFYGWRVGAQVSCESPPPLPGGYTVGERVYFTEESQTFESGNRLEYGKQGEVVGPATGEGTKGKGVAVSFPGNKGAISFYLNHVRRRRRCAATRRFPPHQLPLLPAPTNNVACGRAGKPRAATAAAGRLRGWRAGLLHGFG